MSSTAFAVPPHGTRLKRSSYDAFAPGESALRIERALDPTVAEALVKAIEGPAFRDEVGIDVIDLDLCKLLKSVSLPIARDFLAEDVASILRDFAALIDQRHLQASLSVQTTDGCYKFHTDFVAVRLLCTYVGPGTEWVSNEDVRRENLRRTDVDFQTANRSVLRRLDAVNHCSAGDLLLLKGEMFEGNRGMGAVHRSPPIVERNLRRLVLKVDAGGCC